MKRIISCGKKAALQFKLLLVFNFLCMGLLAQVPELQFPLSHSGEVIDVDFSPDGKYLVSASKDNSAKIWDIENGKLLFTLEDFDINNDIDYYWGWRGIKQQIKSVRFSDDGKHVLTKFEKDYNPSGNNVQVAYFYVWDAFTGKLEDGLLDYSEFKNGCKGLLYSELKKWKTVSNHPKTNSISSNGKYYLSVKGEDQHLEIFDAKDGRSLIKALKNLDQYQVTFTPDGNHVLAIDLDDKIIIYDVLANKIVFSKKIPGHLNVEFSNAGNFALIQQLDKEGKESCQILQLEISTGKIVNRFGMNERYFDCLAYDEKLDRLYVIAGFDEKKRLISFHGGSVSYEVFGAFQNIFLEPDGNILGIMNEGKLERFNASQGNKIGEVNDYRTEIYSSINQSVLQYTENPLQLTSFFNCNEVKQNEDSIYRSRKYQVLSILTNDGNDVDTAGIKLYFSEFGTHMTFTNNQATPKHNFLSFSKDGKLMVTTNTLFEIEIWSLETRKKLVVCKGDSRRIVDRYFVKNGKELVVADDAGTQRIIDVKTGKILFSADLNVGDIIEYTNVENQIKVTSFDKIYIAYYDIKTGAAIPDSLIKKPESWRRLKVDDENEFEIRELSYENELRKKSDNSVVKTWTDRDWNMNVWNGKYLHLSNHGDQKNFKNEIINLNTGEVSSFEGKVIYRSWKTSQVYVLKENELATFDFLEGKWIKSIHGDFGPSDSYVYSLNNDLLYLVNKKDRIMVWDMSKGVVQDTLIDPGADFADIDLIDDFLVGITPFKFITLFNLESKKKICRADFFNDYPEGLEISPNKDLLIAWGPNNMCVIDLKEGKMISSINCGITIDYYNFSPDGKFVWDQHEEGDYVDFFNPRMGISFSKAHLGKYDFDEDEKGNFSIKLSNTGKRLATHFRTKKDGYIKIWNPETGAQISSIYLEELNGDFWKDERYLYSKWSSTDKYLLVTNENGYDGIIRHSIFEVETAKEVFSFLGDEGSFEGFSGNDEFFYTGRNNKLFVREIKTGKVVEELQVGGYPRINDDKVILQDESKLVYWNIKESKELLTWISLGPKDHVVVHPDGYFDGTPEGISKLYYRKGMEFIPVEAYFEQFYRPGLWERIITGQEIEKSSTNFNEQKPLPGILFLNPSTGKIEFRGSGIDLITTTSAFGLKFNITDMGGGVNGWRIYQNGKLIEEKNLVLQNGERKTLEVSVILQSGLNEFKVTAMNNEKFESSQSAVIKFDGKENTPSDLYLIAIGINQYQKETYDLNYAVPDAEAFKSAMSKSGSSIFKKVRMKFITDEKATKSNILSELKTWTDSIKPNDVFVFYYAGHGSMTAQTTDGVSEFYLVPHDVTNLYSNEMLNEKGISAEELQKLSKDIKAQKQLFMLDACQSGGALDLMASRGAVEEKAMAILARSTGTYWLTASGSEQLAGEFASIGHGVFTFSVLLGLSGKGDGDGDGKISVKELSYYIENTVPELSEKFKGNAQYPVSYGFGQDFPLGISNTFSVVVPENSSQGKYASFSLEELKRMKQEAVSAEEYDKAAELKKEIDSRK